jgi:hypothetical protein
MERHNGFQTKDVSKESLGRHISMDTILFLQSIVHFRSHMRYIP